MKTCPNKGCKNLKFDYQEICADCFGKLTDKERWDIIDRLAEIPKLTNDLSYRVEIFVPNS